MVYHQTKGTVALRCCGRQALDPPMLSSPLSRSSQHKKTFISPAWQQPLQSLLLQDLDDQAGADTGPTDKDGLMALHCAASRGHTECIQTLVSIMMRFWLWMLLLYLLLFLLFLLLLLLFFFLLRYLLQVMLCGAEVNALDASGCSPIFYSVALGYVDATRSPQSIWNITYLIIIIIYNTLLYQSSGCWFPLEHLQISKTEKEEPQVILKPILIQRFF